jgi:hypothetical protein
VLYLQTKHDPRLPGCLNSKAGDGRRKPRGADSDSQVGEIIMASAASLTNFLLAGDNPLRNSKTNNAGINVRDRSPITPESAPMDERGTGCADTRDGRCGLKYCCYIEGRSEYCVTGRHQKAILSSFAPF